MSKDKRKLRADAVERLKNSVGARVKPDAAIIAIVWGRVGQADWSLECDKLIDLLTDDEQPETYHDEFYDCESSVDASEDTREKLEADACTFVARAWEAGRTFERRDSNTRCEDVAWSSDELIDLLNRQEAITERECREYEDALREQHHKRIAELKAERDELREKYNDLLERRTKVECDCDCCKWQEERDELRCQVSELRELNDSLHARIESAREVLS